MSRWSLNIWNASAAIFAFVMMIIEVKRAVIRVDILRCSKAVGSNQSRFFTLIWFQRLVFRLFGGHAQEPYIQSERSCCETYLNFPKQFKVANARACRGGSFMAGDLRRA